MAIFSKTTAKAPPPYITGIFETTPAAAKAPLPWRATHSICTAYLLWLCGGRATPSFLVQLPAVTKLFGRSNPCAYLYWTSREARVEL
jgi:hypothetical protein